MITARRRISSSSSALSRILSNALQSWKHRSWGTHEGLGRASIMFPSYAVHVLLHIPSCTQASELAMEKHKQMCV
jgi:hypothetical protein